MPPAQTTFPTLIKRVPFTLLLALLIIVVYILTFVHAGAPAGTKWTITLLRFGAQYNPLTLDGEWYRILTYMFLHGSLVHLGANIYFLLYAGSAVELRFGTKKSIFVYFVSGVAAAFSGLYWNLLTIGIGASGAISGMLGFLLVYFIFFAGKSPWPMVNLLIHFGLFASMNLLMSVWMYPDHAAQFGGVLAGILIGFFSFAPGNREAFKTVKVEYLIIGLLILLYFLIPRNQVNYFKFFRQVVAAEDTTKYLLKEKLTDDDMRSFIRNYHHWDNILTRLNGQTNLPAGLGTDTFKLRKYIGLRKQENLFKKMVVQHETYTYLDSVEQLHKVMQQYLSLDYALWASVKLEDVAEDSSAGLKMLKVYYNAEWAEAPPEEAVFYRVGRRDSAGAWDGPVRDYYRDGAIRMKGTFKEGKRDGVFLFYSHDSVYREAGRYVDDRKFGKWQAFHRNGKIRSEIFYNNGVFVHSVWDSLGNRLVVDGNGREIQRYPNGVVAVEGEYHEGMKDGYWYGRYPNGELYFEEYFSRGRLLAGKSRTTDNKTFAYDESSLHPMPAGGYEKFHQYLKSEAKKVDADELGHVRLSFRVSPSGALTDIKIEQRANAILDAKAMEILLRGPRWLPAREHGHLPVEGFAFVQVEFY